MRATVIAFNNFDARPAEPPTCGGGKTFANERLRTARRLARAAVDARHVRPLYATGQADSFERDDQIPAHIRLPPTQAEPRGAGIRVMIPVPVFAPGRELQRKIGRASGREGVW